MNHVFVWTFGDVSALVTFGLIIAVVAIGLTVKAISDVTRRIFRNRK